MIPIHPNSWKREKGGHDTYSPQFLEKGKKGDMEKGKRGT
jgi:hypothetical protein